MTLARYITAPNIIKNKQDTNSDGSVKARQVHFGHVEAGEKGETLVPFLNVKIQKRQKKKAHCDTDTTHNNNNSHSTTHTHSNITHTHNTHNAQSINELQDQINDLRKQMMDVKDTINDLKVAVLKISEIRFK
jgi:hypothetical protein